MKFAVATLFAAATGALAYPGNVTVVTEVVESYVTYCPSPTTITHGSSTYTVTEPTTLTITDCPCTITKPVITTSSVVCHTCTEPAYTNSTATVPPTVPAPTGGITITTQPGVPTSTPPPTAGAAKIGFSGLAVAAIVALL